jgi:hypothetical protein
VVHEEHTVVRAMDVEFYPVGSEFECATERGDRVLRLFARSATVGDDFGLRQINSSSGYWAVRCRGPVSRPSY